MVRGAAAVDLQIHVGRFFVMTNLGSVRPDLRSGRCEGPDLGSERPEVGL